MKKFFSFATAGPVVAVSLMAGPLDAKMHVSRESFGLLGGNNDGHGAGV